MTRFHPPPGWPVPESFSPAPQWQPDPAWPAAPDGWVFWTDEPAAAVDPADGAGAAPRSGGDAWRRTPLHVALAALGVTAIAVAGVVAVRPDPTPTIRIRTVPATAPLTPGPAIVPDWPMPYAGKVDFSAWTPFGGVDARLGANTRSVVLDTYDTTHTWRTKWSGLVEPGLPRCELHMRGRVRSITHTAGVPGGFGVGLATLGPGSPDTTELTGTGVQVEFGSDGYRVVTYPDDSGSAFPGGTLDNSWHDIDVRIDATGHTLAVDGVTRVQSLAEGQCGLAVLRVWAGSAEFADFSFRSD